MATAEAIRDALTERFGELSVGEAYGELTIHISPSELLDVLMFCRDDETLACDYLADLSGVHWPAGGRDIERQPATSGWPTYRIGRQGLDGNAEAADGVIEVNYILRSTSHNHWFRVAVATDDTDPRLPSATSLYLTANFHEREVYDFFGVVFDGHPDLTRILMPEDWIGHPHRKDYPLGGVDIPYKNDAFIPPPDERELREVPQ